MRIAISSAPDWITGRWWICALTKDGTISSRQYHDSPRAKSKFFSTHGPTSYLNAQYKRGDFLFFGGETKGLGKEFLSERTDRAYRIPIFEAGVRSLNLSNAVSIVVYEALRQTGALSSS